MALPRDWVSFARDLVGLPCDCVAPLVDEYPFLVVGPPSLAFEWPSFVSGYRFLVIGWSSIAIG